MSKTGPAILALYNKAVASLGAAQASAWAAVEAAMGAMPLVPSKDPNRSGQGALRNIQGEQQLSSDPHAAQPDLMRECLAAFSTAWHAHGGDLEAAYKDVQSGGYALKGQPLQNPPATLFRYINGPGIFTGVRVALEGAGLFPQAQDLEKRIQDAKQKKSAGGWQSVLEYVQTEVWDDPSFQDVWLTKQSSMFVTFDLEPLTPRQSAALMHNAMGLWKPRDECFIEVRFARADDDLRFPTFVDAGFFEHFRPTPVPEPHGWTNPHPGPGLPSQPEAVMDPTPLNRLQNPDDFRILP